MRTIALGVLFVALAGVAPVDAQLPLLKNNDFIYAHHHLNVPNLDEAKKFWVDTLGGTAAPAGPLQMASSASMAGPTA